MAALQEYKCPCCGGAIAFDSTLQKMKCPFCDTEMLHGYLNCGTAIWSERKHRISTRPDYKEIYAMHLEVPLMSPHQVESDCCPNCKRLIIDIADYKNNLG